MIDEKYYEVAKKKISYVCDEILEVQGLKMCFAGTRVGRKEGIAAIIYGSNLKDNVAEYFETLNNLCPEEVEVMGKRIPVATHYIIA